MSILKIPEGSEAAIVSAYSDEKASLAQAASAEEAVSALAGYVQNRYNIAKSGRFLTEQRMMAAWKQFNGEPSDEERASIAAAKKRNPTASALSVNITKTKTLAAYSQVCEILFGDKEFPLALEATPEPDGILDRAYLAPEQFPDDAGESPDIYGYEGDGRTIEPGATYSTLLGGVKDKFSRFIDAGRKVMVGASPDPMTMPEIRPAEKAAARMHKVVQDQIKEKNIESEVRNMVLESCILGTGWLRRPLTVRETVHRWEKTPDGVKYTPEEKLMPAPHFVSAWNVYPDPQARRVKDAAYVIERHPLDEYQLKKLKKQPFFNKVAIDEALNSPSSYIDEWWEGSYALDEQMDLGAKPQKWLVLEYSGYIDKEMLHLLDEYLNEKELDKINDVVAVNIWVWNNRVLRCIINPYTPATQEYYAVPFEEHPNQIWGKGLPENMADTQRIINGHLRMATDNLKFAGSVMFEVNRNYLKAGQDMSIYNGKIWETNGGPPGQSIYPITVPNVSQSNLQFVTTARQMADEATGQPSYSYGQYTTGQTRTASGMSMLMSAANLSIKTVVKNFDEQLIKPMGEAYFYWNMQFNEDIDEIRGDINVVARGTDALMQKEVQSQRLLQFLQVAGGNPQMAPFVNIEYTVGELAKSLGLDKDKAVNDRTNAMLTAEIMGKLTNAINQGSGQQAPNPSNSGGQQGSATPSGNINPSDTSGGGGSNIGVGNAPTPGEAGFSASAPSNL